MIPFRHPNRRVFRLVLQLLEHDGWTRDDYHLRHSSGVRIWYANSSYGLSVAIDGNDVGPYNLGSEGLRSSWLWRIRLYRACVKCIARQSEKQLGSQIERFADNVLSFAKAKLERGAA
jgi:hypothetical protein